MSDYKELVERLRDSRKQSWAGAVYNEPGLARLLKDAVSAIENLLEERDALLKDLRGKLRACKHYNAVWPNECKCAICKHEIVPTIIPRDQCEDNWQWRGIGGTDA